jgi:type IV pilus assembly protein PilY1
MNKHRLTVIGTMAIIGWLATATTSAQASLLNLPNTPLILGIETVPNIFILMDDSGSMDWEVLTGNHWSTCNYTLRFGNIECPSNQYSDAFLFSVSGQFISNFYYYSDTNGNAYSDTCAGLGGTRFGNTSVRACLADANINPLDRDWRFMSSDLNLMAFNPQVQYQPWRGFDDANFNAARSDPQPGTAAYTDLIDLSAHGGFEYSVWEDSHGFEGNRPNAHRPNVTTVPNGMVDLFDNHIRVSVRNNSVSCQRISTQPNGSRRIRYTSTPISGAACSHATGGQSLASLQQNIANWYQYARKRHFIAKSAVIDTLETSPGFRYGLGLINSRSNVFVEIPSADDADLVEHNEAIQRRLLDYPWAARDTPLRTGLDRVGRYYKNGRGNAPSPITEACQKNFTLTFTDGFWSNNDRLMDIGDSDKDKQADTLADVAYYYYSEDLSPLPDEVPPDLFDDQDQQHMVTYTVAFGLDTGLVDTDGDGQPNPPLAIESEAWWKTSGPPIQKVDDLWHAAFNSRGQFIASQRPEDVTAALRSAVQNIERRVGSAASGASNGGSLNSNSRLFQARFFSEDWHGELLAFDIDDSGQLSSNPTWDAGHLLTQRPDSYFLNQRRVFTYDPEGNQGRPFFYDNLNPAQQRLMDTNPDTQQVDHLGVERVAYLRGSNANEGNPFRTREHRLGDLINSDPVFVGEPSFLFNLDGYASFIGEYENRRATVYVGANDGMLHAFDAINGEELFSYLPNAVMPDLPLLTSPSYAHRFFVDGSPIYSDARINGTWRSILLGGLRSGGQGIYALDITDPRNFSADDVLWEFTDSDDPDLGFTFGQPTIARMANGQWAAIFGNGFNNTLNDGHVSASGDAVLYIAFLEQGINGWSTGDFIKIPTHSGSINRPSGLGSPGVVDIDGDFTADYIYAGDINGKLWKFDVSSASPSAWTVDFNGQALFEARSPSGGVQPILERPGVVLHPTGGDNGVIVTFGTGKFIENSDRESEGQATQSVYGIWDRDASLSVADNAHGFSRSQLAQVRFSSGEGFRFRDASSESPVWFNDEQEIMHRGWFIDLPAAGERVVEPVLIRSNILFFVSLIPSDNPCTAGGTGFVIGLDARNGELPAEPLFDVNGDNSIDEADYIDAADGSVIIGQQTEGIPNLPAIIFDRRSFCEQNPGHPNCQSDEGGGGDGSGGGDNNGPRPRFPPPLNAPRLCGGNNDRALLYTTQSNGTISTFTAAPGSVQCGRQGWRHLR